MSVKINSETLRKEIKETHICEKMRDSNLEVLTNMYELREHIEHFAKLKEKSLITGDVKEIVEILPELNDILAKFNQLGERFNSVIKSSKANQQVLYNLQNLKELNISPGDAQAFLQELYANDWNLDHLKAEIEDEYTEERRKKK